MMKLRGVKLAAYVVPLIFAACTPPAPNHDTVNSTTQQVSADSLVGKSSLTIANVADGSTVYSDAVASSSLRLVAGTTYTATITVEAPPPGLAYGLACTQTNIPSGPTFELAFVAGDNAFSVVNAGDYSCVLTASATGMTSVTKAYLMEVNCINPTLTVAMLNPNNIAVTAGTGSNLYNFSAANVTPGGTFMLGGQAAPRFSCAWDPTGVGIQDTSFGSCDTARVNVYVNYVASRDIGLIVKDNVCNTSVTVSKILTLPYSVPAMPGNVFIFGQLSNATGTVVGDARVDGVTYLATNSGGHNIVQPTYSSTSGNGTFEIHAYQNYQMQAQSSKAFGMKIVVNGITDTINPATASGTISASAASLYSVTYSTDQAGDQAPQISLTSPSCTLSQQGATVLFGNGTPCSAGQSGTGKYATVEVWGHYSCTLTHATGSTQIEGDFDGYTNIVDNCIGGGGGGGGGIDPIDL